MGMECRFGGGTKYSVFGKVLCERGSSSLRPFAFLSARISCLMCSSDIMSLSPGKRRASSVVLNCNVHKQVEQGFRSRVAGF